MGRRRRSVLKTAGTVGVFGLAGCLGGGSGNDEEYPSRAITVVIPFASGGATDAQYRVFQPYHEEALGVSTEVDNRSGAGGRTGIDYLYNQSPDGYTVALNDISTTIMGSELFNPEYSWGELTPLATLSMSYMTLLTQPGFFEDFEDFRSNAPNMDETLTIGTVGPGTANHLQIVTTMDALGIEDYRSIAYGGGASVGNAVANGDVHVGMGDPKPSEGLVDDGQVDPLIVFSNEDSIVFPEIPTVSDVDVDGLEAFGLEQAFFGPPDLNGDPVSTFVDSVMEGAQTEEYANDAAEQGVVPKPLNKAETEERIRYFEGLVDQYRDQLQQVE